MPELTVALDAGHGGSDPGATYKGRQEKDDTLRLVKAVGAILENNGINVVYTRTNDIYETPFKKASDGNNSGADFFISLHRNSSETPNQYSGAETLVYSNDGIRAVMAENINDELSKAGFRNLGVDERPNLVVLKRTQMPAALVEVGFINSDEDNKTFDENFNKIAQGIANGIIKTLYSQNVGYNEISDTDYNNEEDDDDYDYPDYYTDNDSNDSMNPNNRRTTPPPKPNMPDANPSPFPSDYGMFDNLPMNNRRNDYNDSSEAFYRVQVGAYKNKDNAERLLNSLLVEGFPAFIIYDNGYHKVQVGVFRNLVNAIKMERRLRRFNYNTYIAYY